MVEEEQQQPGALLKPLEQALTAYLNPKEQPEIAGTLFEAMRYAVLGGGKRLRPILCCAACLDLGGTQKQALSAACAIEFMHAYSLIHDDLPCMDDDALRRGKPTCHIAFGEATAVLAGDALQTLAFEVLSKDSDLNMRTRLALIGVLAKASGAQGMVAGQIFDMHSSGKTIDLTLLEQLHAKKTGALISAAITMGALCTQAKPELCDSLSVFGEKLGLAFQVVDDILDETQSSAVLGKNAGSDLQQEKNTYPHLLGLDAAQAYASKLEQECHALLAKQGLKDGHLDALIQRLIQRKY